MLGSNVAESFIEDDDAMKLYPFLPFAGGPGPRGRCDLVIGD
jgi:hypothetical protein